MVQASRRILMVDDSPEDRELYRRYLLRDGRYSYDFLEASLGDQGLSLWQQWQPDAVLLDYGLPDLDGLEFLTQLRSFTSQPSLPVIVVTGQGNEAIAVRSMKAGAQDYLVKEQITPEGLQLAVNGVIETCRLRVHLQQRIERERVVAQITQKIHQTLSLEEILQTTVTEVRQFLQTDRVLILRVQANGWGTVITESVGADWTSLLSEAWLDPCFKTEGTGFRGTVANADVQDGTLAPDLANRLAVLQVRASLVVPIVAGERLWGMLMAHHCATTRTWQPLEIELLKELAIQVGIAIQQSELYQQSQTELAERKRLEAERERLFHQEQAAREEAERASRMKDEFLAILSHELRSPLNPILGWVTLLRTRHLDATTTHNALATIERNARLQTQLIDDLLDVAKILRGKLTIEMVSVDLVFVIEAAMDTVRAAAQAKSIQLHAVLSPIGNVVGDTTRLQQIVWNLLSNAIKFTPPQGRVDVHLARVAKLPMEGNGLAGGAIALNTEYAQITVRDSGKGIKPEFLPHIFESFRQEDTSTTRQFGGLGLGLAIVRHLVDAHGGVIWADSVGEGQGASFTVCLPLIDPEILCHLSEPLARPDLDLTGVRVLAVDDEPDTRQLLTVMLTQYGAKSLILASAREALAQITSFQPDVVISDLGMAGMDGYGLIQQIRALPVEQGGKVPAIALTAYARQEDREKALACGYQQHITKPLDPALLIRTVMDLLQG